jgi:hypothetical protein
VIKKTAHTDNAENRINAGIIYWKSQQGKTTQTPKIWRQEDYVTSFAFSSDGSQMLISKNRTVVLQDAQSGNILRSWENNAQVTTVAFSFDGKKIITGSYDKTVVVRDALSGKKLKTFEYKYIVFSAAFSPDEKIILAGFDNGTVELRDALSSEILQTWVHNDRVTAVAFSFDGKKIITGSYDKTVVVRDALSGKKLKTFEYKHSVCSVALSPDEKKILAGLNDGTVEVRDALSSEILQIWANDDTVVNISFVNNGAQVFTTDSRFTKRVVFKFDLQLALSEEIGISEEVHRILPAELAARKSKLEAEKLVRDEYESVVQFNQRVTKWNAAVEVLNSDIKEHYAKLGPLPVDKRAQAFERALSRAYGNPELQDIRYDPETARFFATLKASLDPEFKRLVSIAVPNDQARAAKAKLTSDASGLEVELRITGSNELIWGQPRVRLDGRVVIAEYLDKDFVPPATIILASDPKLKSILPPPISTLPQSTDVRVIDDPNLNKLQMEVLQKEREQASNATRQAEEKRLRERLAELNRQTKPEFEDDLPKLLAKAPASKPNPTLHVLAIGINDYADVPDVPFAERSAQQFAEIAKKLLGAEPQNVIVLTDSQATLGRLLGRLNTLLNRLGPEDQLLFYYAGHGVPAKDGSGAFLLAQDGGSGSYEQLPLRLGHLYKAIAKSKVGQAKIFIDACFSGRSGKDTIVFEGIAPVVPKVDQSFPNSQRLAVVTAGRGDQFSNQDKVRGHRLFSYHLMRLLLEEGPKLEIAQLHKRLRDIVLNESRRIGPEFEQEPDLQGNGRMVVFGSK